jgi:hypothetical protein
MKRVRFHIQPTKSFPEGAPQREEYNTDRAHHEACGRYAAEWRREFTCTGCRNFDCPQHGEDIKPIFTASDDYDFKAMRIAADRGGR